MDTQSILMKWVKMPETAAFKEAYLSTLNYVAGHPYVKLYCTDLTLSGSLNREQEGWLYSEYYALVYNIIRDDIYAAVVFSEDHFKALVTNYLATPAVPNNDFIHFNYFTEQEEALSWLGDIYEGRYTAVLQHTGH
ncbi:hypothetical protein [Pontibacter vulgaris]|uniref:hypothetical protein n=1 Tax=Pontibacter vulgaris TaxID=2905679 RepID=UPI001FA76F40|nr:hypothetical protein [Pontibacter vulgaris]